MNFTSKLIILFFLLCIFNNITFSQENDTINPKDHKSKINDFIKRLRKNTPTSMHDFFTYFGENNELEIQYIRNYCDKDSISFPDCVELSKKLYSSPFKFRSLTFNAVEKSKLGKFIQKLHPGDSIQVNSDTTMIEPTCYIINTKENHYIIKMNLLKSDGNFISDILNEEKISIFTFK